MEAMWPSFDRACSPHPLSLEVRRPWRNHALVTVEEGALESLLPEYARQAFRRPYDAEEIINQFILDSPELWPRTKTNPLVEEELRDVYYVILEVRSPNRFTSSLVILINSGHDPVLQWRHRQSRSQ